MTQKAMDVRLSARHAAMIARDVVLGVEGLLESDCTQPSTGSEQHYAYKDLHHLERDSQSHGSHQHRTTAELAEDGHDHEMDVP